MKNIKQPMLSNRDITKGELVILLYEYLTKQIGKTSIHAYLIQRGLQSLDHKELVREGRMLGLL